MSRATSALKAGCIGLLLSGITVAIAIGAAMAGASFMVELLIQFSLQASNLLSFMLPSALLYQLVPDGGGPAFVGLVIGGAFLQLSLVYAVGTYFLWFSRRAR